MPKVNDAKTGSAPRLRRVLLMLAVGLTAGAGAWWLYGTYESRQDTAGASDSATTAPATATPGYASRQLRVDDREFILDVADTPEKQQLGLGKRESLPEGKGMVFIYPEEGRRCFWMKDMNFAIDIIWLDAERRIVHIEHGVKPETYPDTFCPKQGARYVVELNAGRAAQAGLKPGQRLDF